MKTTLNALSILLTKASLLLVAIAATNAVYPVQPTIPSPTVIQQVSSQATYLSVTYGSRPPYTGQKFASGAFLTPDEAQIAAPYLLACESRNTPVGCILDDNHKLSCGPGQFQDWGWWESVSGIHGDPNAETSSVTMMMWGLENGYIQRWGCATAEKIIP